MDHQKLLSTFHPFQKQIYNECKHRTNGGLALPMGSGKTRIALALALSSNKPSLIVCTKSEMTVWHDEINTLLPNTKFEILHSSMIKKIDQWKPDPDTKLVVTNVNTLTKYFDQYDLLSKITEYHKLFDFMKPIQYWSPAKSPLMKLEDVSGPGHLYAQQWGYLIIDEAQTYTNIKTKGCRSLLALAADRHWLLSGTMFNEPTTQRMLGYWCLLRQPFTPRSMPDATSFIKGSCIRYNLRGDLILDRRRRAKFKGLKPTMVYRETNPHYKPPKIISEVVTNQLTSIEAKVYTHFRKFFVKVYQTMKNLLKQDRKAEAKLMRGNLLAIITYLRLTLVAPILALDALAKNTISDKITNEELVNLLQRMKDLVIEQSEQQALEAKPSSRLQKILTQIKKYPQRRLVIFFGFRKSLNRLNKYIQDRKVFVMQANSMIERQKVLTDFKASENGILLLTYSIGANGLNLQASSVVFIMEYWWNKGRTQQALARVNRMGQTAKEIYLIYFTSGTAIEEALLEKSNDKEKVYQELLIGNQKSKVKKMDLERIYQLIETEINVNLIEKLYL